MFSFTNREIIQIISSLLGSFGFAVLYNIRGKKLAVIAIGGALGWTLYLLCRSRGLGLYPGLFIGTFFVSALSAILARIMRTPVLVFQIPMTIPMIPGGDLYYTARHLVEKDFATFGVFANKVLSEAFAMALGIAVASYLVRSVVRVASWRRR